MLALWTLGSAKKKLKKIKEVKLRRLMLNCFINKVT